MRLNEMKKYKKVVFFLLSVVLLATCSVVSSKDVKAREAMYEEEDIQTLKKIKGIFSDDNIDSSLESYISENMKSEGYCDIFLGYTHDLSSVSLEWWYEYSNDSIKSELKKYDMLLSQMATKEGLNGVYAYFYENGEIKVDIENTLTREIVISV